MWFFIFDKIKTWTKPVCLTILFFIVNIQIIIKCTINNLIKYNSNRLWLGVPPTYHNENSVENLNYIR